MLLWESCLSLQFHRVKADHPVYSGLEGECKESLCMTSLGSVIQT